MMALKSEHHRNLVEALGRAAMGFTDAAECEQYIAGVVRAPRSRTKQAPLPDRG